MFTVSKPAALRAKYLLAHYLKFGVDAGGYRWDDDNQAEVDEIVDAIVDACQSTQPDALKRIADALERIADALEPAE